jgi:hypothetical protein
MEKGVPEDIATYPRFPLQLGHRIPKKAYIIETAATANPINGTIGKGPDLSERIIPIKKTAMPE